MKKLVSICLLFISSSVFSAPQSLPRGGKINLNSKNWIGLENKVFQGVKTFIVSNKKHKDLTGYLLGGTIENESKCKVKTSNKWATCQETHTIKNELSYQIYLQRKIGKNGFQTYVLSFNFPKEALDKYKKSLVNLEKDLSRP